MFDLKSYFKEKAMNQGLKMAEEKLPDMEVGFAKFIASQSLEPGEKSAMIVAYPSKDMNINIGLVACDETGRPTRYIFKVTIREFLEQLKTVDLSNFEQAASEIFAKLLAPKTNLLAPKSEA